jgi:predicted nuclease of predicted toxin-antitoxin system
MLRQQKPSWRVDPVNELGFAGKADEFLYQWAQDHKSTIITFDEHFADARFHGLGRHYGVVRLRVWPTTTEAIINALSRLLERVSDDQWRSSLIIVDNQKIRVRRT